MNILKTFYLVFLALVALTLNLNAQIKVTSSNFIGIGTTEPTNHVEIKSGELNFTSPYPTRRKLYFNHWGTDPRIESNYQVVFYNTESNDHIDIAT